MRGITARPRSRSTPSGPSGDLLTAAKRFRASMRHLSSVIAYEPQKAAISATIEATNALERLQRAVASSILCFHLTNR